jgi:rubrerythrin
MLLRDILAREISTINNYQSLLSQASSAEVATFISHILEEEKEHVAEAIELIKELDPNQAALLSKGSHWKNDISTSHLNTIKVESHAPTAKAPHAWTVGSLKGEK